MCVHLDSDVKLRTEKSDKKRPGYCECCGARFDDFLLVSDVDLYHMMPYCFSFSLPACEGGPTYGLCN